MTKSKSNNSKVDKKIKICPSYSKNSDVVIYNGLAIDFLNTVPKGSIDLIITSPPYNIGKEYEDKKELSDYLDTQEDIIPSLCEVLSESGSICWQVGNYIKNGEVFPLDIYYYKLFKSQNLFLRNRIIWRFGHGLHASKRFSGRYETILWFTKSENYKFNLDSVRIPAKYPGKRSSSGNSKGELSGNPKGKNPSDFWEINSNHWISDWENGIWEIPNVKANHVEKTIHPCQFPVELVERCVLALTDEYDSVLDPFMGVGSTLLAAIIHNRKALGSEKDKRYSDIALDRINKLENGTLRTRPLGKPVYKPSKKEKVAQIPVEWKNNKSSIYHNKDK